jgi:hypothetical protein
VAKGVVTKLTGIENYKGAWLLLAESGPSFSWFLAFWMTAVGESWRSNLASQ